MKKPKAKANSIPGLRESAALVFLRSRTRVGEGSLKLWCQSQLPPVPVYQAEGAMAALSDQGLATVRVDPRTGNRSWSAVAPPATVTDLQLPADAGDFEGLKAWLPEPTLIDPTPAKPKAQRKKPAPIVAETCPDCGVGLAGYVCRCEYPEPTPAPEAPAVQVSPLASELEPEPEAPAVSEVRAVELPADHEVIAAVQACCAAESVATRRALGALLVKIGEALIGGTAAAGAAATLGQGGEPEGLVGHQLAVWRALSAEEGRTPKELGAASGVGRDSVPSALRGLAQRKLAFSPRYGLWRRAS